jgi:acetoin utilization deacetylase AcuC-like enzyme
VTTLLLTHTACLEHDAGDYHPECPDRLRAVLRALEDPEFAGLLRRADAPLATPEQLALAHPAAYVSAILGIRPGPRERVQIDGDTAMNHATAEAAQRAAGAAVAAVDAVCSSKANRAFCATRPPGHHAEPSRPMGFCFFANAVVAARHAQKAHGAGRVAILDFDVHHGNGTQACMEDDPTLFYASSHQWPLYPGTGHPRERGAGNVRNAILPPGADGAAFRAAWRDQLLPALDAFMPELIVVSAGFDAHRSDPLAQLGADESDYAWLTEKICCAANRHCEGRVVSLLEGGYDLAALADSAAAHVRVLMRG